MDEAVRDQWLEALRSGEYAKGKKYLREGDAYCCLGVLCDLAIESGVIGPPEAEGDVYNYSHQISYLPHVVEEWADLDFTNQDDLAMANDHADSFDPVIKIIETL